MKNFLYLIVQCTWGILQSLLGLINFLLHIRDRHYFYHGAVITEWNDKSSVSLGMFVFVTKETSVYKGYKRDKIEMRGDRAEMSDFPLYLNTVAGGLDRRDQTIGGFSFVVKIYAVPVVEIIG